MTVPDADDAEEILRVLRSWLDRDVAPVVLELEHADEYPRQLVEQMREFGSRPAMLTANAAHQLAMRRPRWPSCCRVIDDGPGCSS